MRILLLCAALLPASLLAQDGRITTSGKPGAAGVFIDGKFAGPAARFGARGKFAASAGEHTVTIRDPRFEEFSTKITVSAGKTAKVKYTLKPLAAPQAPLGIIRLGGGNYGQRIEGDRGAVYLNGVFMGHVDEFNHPGSGIEIKAGAYELKVVSEEFGEINRRVTVEPGKVVKVPIRAK